MQPHHHWNSFVSLQAAARSLKDKALFSIAHQAQLAVLTIQIKQLYAELNLQFIHMEWVTSGGHVVRIRQPVRPRVVQSQDSRRCTG